MTVLVLTGPTGTGKTDWAARLAEFLPVEIVSVDSALVYRGMDIGTAKPSRELRARIPHHLIDILDPADSYSAGRSSPTPSPRSANPVTGTGFRCWWGGRCFTCARC